MFVLMVQFTYIGRQRVDIWQIERDSIFIVRGERVPIQKGRGCSLYLLGVKSAFGTSKVFSLRRSTAEAFAVSFRV